MSMVLARIILRYLAAALMTAGILAPDVADQIGADPDLVMLLGSGLAVLTELAYARAKAKGGQT
jgi:hypothetical protein